MIRQTTLEDLPAIAALEAAPGGSGWTTVQLAGSLALPTIRAWVFAEDDRILGHVLATAIADEGEIQLIAVHPDARRRGIGRRLLEQAHRTWTREGVGESWLEVRTDNAGALALYRSLGWTEEGTRPRYYRDGTDARVLCWRAPTGAADQ